MNDLELEVRIAEDNRRSEADHLVRYLETIVNSPEAVHAG